MENKDFVRMLEDMHNMEMECQERKSSDYACEEDTLRNFKVVAAIAKTLELPMYEPWAVALWFNLTKLQRMVNLMKRGVVPKNESLVDTIMDARQYTLLGYACYEEASKEVSQSSVVFFS